MSDRENYSVWNMGIDLVLIGPKESENVIARNVKEHTGKDLVVLGEVKKAEDGVKKVIIRPLNNLTYLPD
jgi:phosphoribosylaminoimidazole (AIR) synthetase